MTGNVAAKAIAFLAAFIFLLLCPSDGAAGDKERSGRLADWRYWREIALDPATSQPDLAAPMTLRPDVMGNPYRHVNQDGSDLRVVGPDGKTVLPCWIEQWNPAGVSTVWVRVAQAGTKRLHLLYGNPNARPKSDGRRVFDFFDDFDDGIWTKYSCNPVITRTEPWEACAICEPSVIHEDGIYKMWYMGCRTSVGRNAVLAYATSPDGFTWTKYPDNPILRVPNEAVIRTTVVKNRGTYYLFASDHQWTPDTGVINRWTSQDGLRWTGKTTVFRPTESWEKHFHNVGVIVDDDETWRMLYTTDGPFGYAHSKDGLTWTKHPQPVIKGFYGGDPYLKKIGNQYYGWHSQEHKGHLRIYCRSSPDMIRWEQVEPRPQIGYSQPWERGIGRPEVHWDRHLADAELLEHNGKVLMYYGGAQCPLGVAVFEGSFDRLAERLQNPPLAQWDASPYGCVEGNELRISDSETETEPICERTFAFGPEKKHVFEFRLRCEAGYRQEHTKVEEEGWSSPTRCHGDSRRRVHAIVRYVDQDNFARFCAEETDRISYDERIDGAWSQATEVGASTACDGRWHTWRFVLDGEVNCLVIDGQAIGTSRSSPRFANRRGLRIGYSVRDTFVCIDDVRMTRRGVSESVATIGPEKVTAQ